MRSRMTICLAPLLMSCVDLHADRRVLLSTPRELSTTPFVLRPDEPLRAVGPFNEICLEVPRDYRLGSDTGSNRWKVQGPNGFVAPAVVLLDSTGRRTEFPVAGFQEGQEREICFETRPARDLSRRFTSVELYADAPLRILRVRWSAGNRYASL